MRNKLLSIYRALRRRNGFLNWWPGETPFEVMVGAILTQNTAWSNAEKALSQLKESGLMSPRGLLNIETKRLAQKIRSSGYYNEKAKKLKSFMDFYLKAFSLDIEKMKKERKDVLRKKLLSVKGIGRETADSILLYAIGKKIFVIDAYTKRIFSRLGVFAPENIDYDEARIFFEDNLPRSLKLYNDYHAQIVMLGKNFCRKKSPLCAQCPLRTLCARMNIKSIALLEHKK